MSRLNVDLVQEKKWKLEHLEIKDEAKAIEAVRRRGNAYALNAQGVLIALSMTAKDIDSLILGEECHDLEHLYLGYNEKLTQIEFETNLPKLQYLYLNNCALNGTLRLPEGFANLKQVYVQKNQLQGLVFEGDCPELELLD
ncbi:leucine-rich repeat domain-containing protein, partial [Haliscomenobacter sp.]|uniref:leucine-rich repeat domain-containing protein n=1 Tax=Haliscomenobacter sp. TaxID=2717303 RepID=UPI003364FD37